MNPVKSYFAGTVYENPNNPLVNFNLDSAILLLEEAGWKEKNSDGYRVKNGKVFEVELPFTRCRAGKIFNNFSGGFKESRNKIKSQANRRDHKF